MGKQPKRSLSGAPFDPARKDLELAGEDWKICRLCGVGLSGRRTSYCSDACSDEWQISSDPGFARSKVRYRDCGICAICGLDTARLARFWGVTAIKHYLYRSPNRELYQSVMAAWRRMRKASLGAEYRRTGYWDMDHIKPVILGGGGCGLDNLRTLCIPCHKKETAKLAARRALDRTILPGSQMELWR